MKNRFYDLAGYENGLDSSYFIFLIILLIILSFLFFTLFFAAFLAGGK